MVMKQLFTFFFVILIAMTYGQERIAVEYLGFTEDSICLKDSLPFTGVVLYKLENGNKKTVNYKFGGATGKWEVADASNKRIAIGINKDGKALSNHYEYHKNDSIKVLRKKVNGQLVGKFKHYKNGQLEEVISYQPNCINIDFMVNGVPDSLMDENGEYTSLEYQQLMYPYEKARAVLTDSAIYVFDSLIMVNDFEVPHGKWQKYYPNGELKEDRQYLYGIKAGTWLYHLEDGNMYKKIDYDIYTHIKKEYEFYPKTGIYKSQKLWYENVEYGWWKNWDFQGTLIEEIEKLEVLKKPLPNSIVDCAIRKDYFKPYKLLDSITVTREMDFPVGFRFNDYLITLKTIKFSQIEENGKIIYSIKLNVAHKSTAFVLSLSGCSHKEGTENGLCTTTLSHTIASHMSGPKPEEPNGAVIMENVFLTDLFVHSQFNKWTAFKIVMSEYKELDHDYKLQPK